MKRVLLSLALAASMLGTSAARAADDDLLTGDVRLACEAILCLSTGQPPNECTPSLNRYFSIVKRTMSKTLSARRNFLNLCPSASENDYMKNLVSTLVNGSGRCDVASLNASGGGEGGYISNQMPSYCVAYYADAGLDLGGTPRYVGTPERGGHWVNAADYERELAAYNERIRREDEARYSPG